MDLCVDSAQAFLMAGCLCPQCDLFRPNDDGDYQVGTCGTCHDNIAAEFHKCCLRATRDELDALLVVGYTYGTLHGTRDCQALMARSYGGGNPFGMIREGKRYVFGPPPMYGGSYTFKATLKKRGAPVVVTLEAGEKKVFGPPRPNYQTHQLGSDSDSANNCFRRVETISAPSAMRPEERRIDLSQNGRLVTWQEFVDGRNAQGLTSTILQLHDAWFNLPLPLYQ